MAWYTGGDGAVSVVTEGVNASLDAYDGPLKGVAAHLLLETRLALPANTTVVKHVLLPRPDATEQAYPGTLGVVTSLTGNDTTEVRDNATATFAAPMAGATLRWLTGNNAGVSRVINSYTDADNVVIDALDYDMVVGDTFTVERINSGWQNLIYWLDTDAVAQVSFVGSPVALSPAIDGAMVLSVHSKDPIKAVWLKVTEDLSSYYLNIVAS